MVSSWSGSMKVKPRPKVMLGSSMVQCAARASNRVFGALLTPTENRLLLESLSSDWDLEDPSGVGHMPRFLWALEQSLCSILLGVGSCPDVRATRSSRSKKKVYQLSSWM
jgi:hypothetical protein